MRHVDFDEGAARRAAEACDAAAFELLDTVAGASQQLAATDWSGPARTEASRALAGLAVLARSEAAALRRSADALRAAIGAARRLNERREAARATALRQLYVTPRRTPGCVDVQLGPTISGRPDASRGRRPARSYRPAGVR